VTELLSDRAPAGQQMVCVVLRPWLLRIPPCTQLILACRMQTEGGDLVLVPAGLMFCSSPPPGSPPGPLRGMKAVSKCHAVLSCAVTVVLVLDIDSACTTY
jgi:hypothetical protein